jgi:hypothetical protein
MIQAIETRYKGYRFRSRLEARWAVFFDVFGLRYWYEYQGYWLDAGPYLPDFFLYDWGFWVEIKGQKPTQNEIDKFVQLCLGTQQNGLLVSGMPGQESVSSFYLELNHLMHEMEKICNPWCSTFLHYADNTKYRFDDESPEAQQVFDKHMENCPLVLTAYRESLSARFEHSESPVIKNSPYLPKEGMIRTPTPQEWEEIQLQWKRSTTISTHTR